MAFEAVSPSSDLVITSSGAHRTADSLPIQFGSDWRNNGIMDWHGPRPTKINTLQLRKEKSEPFTHQYVVLILSDDSMLRLDRRGEEPNPANPATEGRIESKDTIANVESLPDLDKSSYCLAELHCQDNDVDLSNIIKICFAIHRDNQAGYYTPRPFNSYFFAWTILVVTARHAAPWDTHLSDLPWKTLSQTLADALSTKFVRALINMIIDGGIIMALAMYSKLKREVSRAVSWRARLAWMMPQWFIRVVMRKVGQSAWGPKISKPLRSKMRSVLRPALELTLHSVLEDLRVSTLPTTLWKGDVGEAMRRAAYPKVMATILDAATKAMSSIRLRREDADAFQSVARTFAHRDFLEGGKGHWGAVFIEGFNAIMQAAPQFAAGGADGFVKDDTKWDELWTSMGDSGQEASRKAMKGELAGRWETLWDALMKGWGAGWGGTGPKIRDDARSTLTKMADLVNDELINSVIDTLPDTHLRIGVTPTMIPPRPHHVSGSESMTGLATVADSELQQYILKLIAEHGRVDMREAMVQVWRAVGNLDGGAA